MDWLQQLIWGEGVAHTVLLFAMVIAGGIALGKIKIFGISLGVTFVLFAGIFLGHFGLKVDHEVLHFMKEFGLILFVYSIGLQLGPSFFSSFKKGGIQLNMLAMGIVILGALTAVGIHFISGIPMSTMVGVLSGAVTNTPGLGAAQQAFKDVTGQPDPTIAMGYAVAYPLAVVGIICSIIGMRYFFRIKLDKESEAIEGGSGEKKALVELISFEVNNPAVFGKTVKEIVALTDRRFVVSRILHNETDKMEIASSKTVLQAKDRVFIAVSPENKAVISALIGTQIAMGQSDWDLLDKQLVARRILISKEAVNGKSLAQLNIRANFGVNITRINRSGVDLVPNSTLTLQIGDRLTVVGDESNIKNVEGVLGNQLKRLNDPHLIPIFVGVALGVLLGSIPFMIPGIPQPVKLGLAGGPLIVAILMSIFGPKYKLVTYTTLSANLMLREIGICFFLACVGLGAGENFVETIVNQGGWQWIGWGFIITVLPLWIIGTIARSVYKMNYFTLMGLLSGSMTDPPALAFSNASAGNDLPAVSYATVYPLTMFLRVLSAQLLILIFI